MRQEMEPPAKRHCTKDNDESVVAAPRDHTNLVHNLYRHLLQHHRLPDWQRFEMLVSLHTDTFNVEMMPPSFLDDETVVVNRGGHGIDCGIDHINMRKTVVGQSKRYTGGTKVDWGDLSKFFLASECLATPPRVRPRPVRRGAPPRCSSSLSAQSE